MNIGLVDIDSHNFPNLCLMKLSAWHKARGDSVELLHPDDVLKGKNLFMPYDKLYGACVFTENAEKARQLKEFGGVYVAGSGIDLESRLPEDVEHVMPDYSLYGIGDTAYGFLTRGCPRQCPFCIVAKKEGVESRKVANLSEWWSGQKNIKLMDPNLLACPEHIQLLRQLVGSGAWVDVTQGLDARLLTDENTELINSMRVKMLHFAWDNPKDKAVPKALAAFAKKSKLDERKKRVYVLTNYWSTHEEDLYRVDWLRGNGYDPYVMIYDKKHAPMVTRKLQRYVNNKFIFHSCKNFLEYRFVHEPGARDEHGKAQAESEPLG